MPKPQHKFNQEAVVKPNMSKLTDTLKAALAKKQGKHHLENDDGVTVEKKAKKTTPPVGAGRPMKKAAGRGR